MNEKFLKALVENEYLEKASFMFKPNSYTNHKFVALETLPSSKVKVRVYEFKIKRDIPFDKYIWGETYEVTDEIIERINTLIKAVVSNKISHDPVYKNEFTIEKNIQRIMKGEEWK